MARSTTGPAPRRVVFLCYDDVELLDIAGPANVFTATTRLIDPRAYDVELVAATPGPVRTAGGIELVARRPVASLRGPVDTVVVPGGMRGVDDANRHLVPHLARIARRARRVAGVCSGAFVLAKAGLLHGRRVTTHWAGCDQLARHYPDIRVERDAIYVNDGRIWTSAGVTAGMDLALALVEQDLGPRAALEVARWLVMYLRRPGGQSQFSSALAAQTASREPIAQLAQWMLSHLDADLSVPALARRSGMSTRQLSRVFRAALGATPAAWVQRARLEAARSALEATRHSVKEIAARCGFGRTESMHRIFRRVLKATPQEYRERFATRSP